MKITRLLLENFIGILHGLGEYKIELFFKDGRIVMFLGGNGSGKTTIMSQLHPFKESFDSRKSLVIDDMVGKKEIDIEHNGSLYEIVHTYETGAKSFIKKDGVEMNENGGVRTFEVYVESELGVTKEYFKIGKIGSNTENFIQFTTSERKKYISKFLPDIEDYLEKFEIVKTKFRELNNNIKAVSKDLGKLEDEDTVKLRIQSAEASIKALEEELEKVSGNVAVITSEKDILALDIAKINLPDLEIQKSDKEKERNLIATDGLKFVSKYGKATVEDCEKIIKIKETLTQSLTNELAVINANKNNTSGAVIGLENEITQLTFSLSEFDISESLDEIELEIKRIEGSLKTLKDSENNTIKEIVKEEKTISTQLSRFEDFKNFLVKYFAELRTTSINPQKSNVEMFLQDNFGTKLETYVKNIRELVKEKQTNLTRNEGILVKKASNIDKLSILEQRPEDCIIDECPFIKDALQYKNLPNEIKTLEDDIVQMKKDLNEYGIKADEIADLKLLYERFNTYYEQMNPRTNKVYVYFVNTYGSILKNIQGNLNDFISHSKELVEDVNTTIFTIQEIATATTNLQNYTYKQDLILNNEKHKKIITDSVAVKQELIKTKNTEFSSYVTDSRAKTNTLNDETEILDEYNTYLNGKQSIKDINTKVKELQDLKDEYIDNSKLIKVKNQILLDDGITLTNLRGRKDLTSDALLDSQMVLASIVNLKTRQAELNTNYSFLELVKNTLDPNKGIPLYFIKSYLEKTKDITNELLDLAFDGDFEINFVTSAKDFFIRVRSGDHIKNDISDASQGETALTTISISLALIEQSIGDYNILALDEIDGPLDMDNRESFLEILNKQIDKLNIEQVFVISHNDAFDTEEMDLILLNESHVDYKGEDFMSNKIVIFEVKE